MWTRPSLFKVLRRVCGAVFLQLTAVLTPVVEQTQGRIMTEGYTAPTTFLHGAPQLKSYPRVFAPMCYTK